MGNCLAAGLLIIIACAIVSGCVLDTVPDEQVNSTPVITRAPVEETFPAFSQTLAASVSSSSSVEMTPTLSLGDHYLQRAYAFHSGSTSYTEQIRVDDPSWGITMSILPLKDDPSDCWFEMTVTNIDTGQTRKFGYGGTYPYDTYQQYPMYTTGAYRITMVGDLVRVDLNVAKRLP
jgi:hypothetical protein